MLWRGIREVEICQNGKSCNSLYRVVSIITMQQIQFWVKNDSNSIFTAFIAANYTGSKEELLASKLGLAAEDTKII